MEHLLEKVGQQFESSDSSVRQAIQEIDDTRSLCEALQARFEQLEADNRERQQPEPVSVQIETGSVVPNAPERVEPVIAQQPAIIPVPTILDEKFGQLLTDIHEENGF